MGIYIKGMEMPKNCNECKFGTWSNLHQTACCKRHDFDPCFKDYSREYMDKRADFCPIVEIPEPHGELIDRDALNASIKELRKIKPLYKLNEFWELEGTEIMNLIMGSPTVIEAECKE